MSSAYSWLRIHALARRTVFCVTLVVFFSALGLDAQKPSYATRRVLILYSFDGEQGIFAGFDRALRSQLRMRARDRVEFYTEYLDLIRFPAPAYREDTARLLKLKYSLRKPDLIVPVSYAAVQFLMGAGKNLFPGTPMVALFSARRLDDLKSQVSGADPPNLTGVATEEEPARTIDLALRLQPDTKHVAVVVGSSELEQYWLNQLKETFQPYASKVEFRFLSGLSVDELLKRIAELPPHTVVLSSFFFQDATGQFFLSEEILDRITKEDRVPVYAIFSSYIGHGVVGGHMTDPEIVGRTLAGLAVAVLNGENAGRIPFVLDDSATDTLDWRQLQRWGISEERLPPGAVELFREPSLWERHRNLVVAMISLSVLETILLLALVLNVRSRRSAEKALLREKTLSDAVIEGLPGVFILKDQSGRHVRWNKNAQDIHRFPLAEDLDLANIADSTKDAVRRAEQQVFESGSSQVEAEILLENGKTAPFYFTGVRVELENKPYLAGIGIDLTETKKGEEAVRRSEAELRSFVEHAPYGIGTINVGQDRFSRANPALVKLLGCNSEEEVLALSISRDLYSNGDARDQATRADFFRAVELLWKRKDGKSVHVRASGRRISKTQGQGDFIEIIAEDVTARRLLEEQLRHAQKMEALGQLAGSVAHDFNNLLGVIIGYSELLSADPRVDAAMGAQLEIIKTAGDRAASLTAQLLAFSRRQILQFTVVDMNSLVRETQKMLQRLMGEDVEQSIDLEPGLWKTKADPGQMVQVIMNLAINSRHAMAKGGTLSLRTRNVTFASVATFYEVDVAAGNYVMLAVTDTGTGMDEHTRTRLFEPFFTTKDAGKGTGLGLATVYGIVKQSGGYIFADSEVGKGTTFKVYLPQVETTVKTIPATVNSDIPRGSETLLVVEDEPAFRDLLRDGLQARGYQVMVAANGVDALQVAEKYPGPIRVLITDVIMPQMSGPQLARSLRKVRPHTDVVYMSGYTDDKVGDISSSGELSLIQKPFYVDELVRRIQQILERQGPKEQRTPVV